MAKGGKKGSGKIATISGPPNILKAARKTTSGGFNAGGAVNRARGGRTSAPFSSGQTGTSRSGSSTSGHEGE